MHRIYILCLEDVQRPLGKLKDLLHLRTAVSRECRAPIVARDDAISAGLSDRVKSVISLHPPEGSPTCHLACQIRRPREGQGAPSDPEPRLNPLVSIQPTLPAISSARQFSPSVLKTKDHAGELNQICSKSTKQQQISTAYDA